MRTRFYNPELKRFMNADIIDGSIADSTSLNLYTYVNGNPISFVDPFGLSAERGNNGTEGNSGITQSQIDFGIDYSKFTDPFFVADTTVQTFVNEDTLNAFYNSIRNGILTEVRPNNIGVGTWAKYVDSELKYADDLFGKTSVAAKGVKALPYVSAAVDTGIGIIENINEGTAPERIASDAVVDVGFGLAGIGAASYVGGLVGSFVPVPVVGTLVGAGVGTLTGIVYYGITEAWTINGKSISDWTKDGVAWLGNKIGDGIDNLCSGINDGLNAIGSFFGF